MKLFKSGGLLSVVIALASLVFVYARGVTTEIAVGNVQGLITHKETGKIAPNATVTLTSTEPADPDGRFEIERRVVRTNAEGKYLMRNVPVGTYQVQATTRRADLYQDNVIVQSAKTTSQNLQLVRLPMSFSLSSAQRVFLPTEKVQFNVGGVTDQKEIKAIVYEVPLNKLTTAKEFGQVLSGIIDRRTMMPMKPTLLNAIRNITLDITETDGEGGFQQELFVEGLPEGVYWLSTSLTEGKDTEYRGAYFAVSQIGLVAKVGSTKGLVQVVDLETGKAVPGVPVRQVGNTDKLVDLGQTSADGTLTINSPSRFIGVFAQLGKSTAFLTTSLYGRSSVALRSTIYSDRPVYRPGDEVMWKGILRIPNAQRYALPRNMQITGTIEDPDGVQTTTAVQIGPSGTITGKFLTKIDTVGYYSLRLTGVVDGIKFEEGTSFEVAAYRKPEFKITAKPVRDYYTKGDVIEVEVTCENYFGGPVANAKIDSSVSYSARYYGDSWFDEYSSGSYSGDTEQVRTDDTGRAIIRFPASKVREANLDESSNLEDWNVRFSITGDAGDSKYFEASATVPVLQGELGLNVQTDRFVAAPGENVATTVKVVNAFDQKPVSNQAVTISYGYYEWDKMRSRFVPSGKVEGRTDSTGSVVINVPVPDANDVQLRATTQDKSGNMVGAAASIWVTTDRVATKSLGSLEVKMDRASYAPQASAKALILTDKPGGDALLTVELDDLTFQQVVPLTSQSTMVNIPVENRYFPNATVSVVRVQSKRFQEASTSLMVADSSNQLKVSVRAQKPKYQPGELATFAVDVRDHQGKPVASDLSFGLVDESVYAVREDTTDLVQAFYPGRSSNVSTYYSFPEVYLDGGDKESNAKMKKFGEARKDFRDTAEFRANVRTSATGTATVAVKLPDNLTSWRATVLAVSDTTQIGKAVGNVLVQKPLMVRLSLPTILTEGDEAELSALVTNNTETAQQVELGVMANGLTITGAAEQKLSIAAGKTEIVTWPTTAGPEGTATMTAGVRAGNLRDAVELPVSIQTRRAVEREYLSGLLKPASETINRQFSGDLRRVRVFAANSMLDLMRPAVDQLVDFEYLCAEQTTSRYVPALVLRSLTPNPDPAWSARITDVTARSLRRLRQLQASGGGFTWYDNGEADAGMTAIVMDGLATARALGVDTEIDLKSTLAWADQLLAKNRGVEVKSKTGSSIVWDSANLHLAAAVLTENPNAPGAQGYIKAWRTAHPKGKASIAEELLYAAAYGSPDVSQIESQLAATKDIGSVDSDWNTDRVVGRAIRMLARAKPSSDQLQRLVGLAVSRRRGAGWTSTRDTAEIILGLASLPNVAATEPGEMRVLVDGQLVALQDGVLDLKDRKVKSLEIANTGTGQLAYSVMIEKFGKPGPSPALSPDGMSVERTFHTLEVVKMSDNSSRLVANTNSREKFRSGDVVREVFRVKNPQTLSFVQVTLPRVSGLEPADDPTADYWEMWYAGIQVFDDRITMFVDQLEPGEHKFELNYRAEKPGSYVVRSGWLAPMYQPDFIVRGTESRLQVVP